jgi:hypothetical protein
VKKLSIRLVLLATMFSVTAIAPRPEANAASLGGMVLKGAAIGYVVKQSAGGLNKFINKVTFNNHVSTHLATKVVPIMSVGEKAYVGGAQVAGPASAIKNVKVVWQYEGNFSDNRFRLKVLVPSNSLSPLKISRVSKVGVTALIDLSLSGGWDYGTEGRAMRAGDVLLAAGVAVLVKNTGPTLNKAINTISFNKGMATKVVPMLSVGEKAYIGGGQVSGSASAIRATNAIFQYEDFFSGGKFRVNIMVPTTSANPLKFKRVDGAGVSAVVEMSLARQRDSWDRNRDRYLFDRYQRRSDVEDRYRHRQDNGLHNGWWQGKHKGWYKNGKDDRRIQPQRRDKIRIPDWFKRDSKRNRDDQERDKDKEKRNDRNRDDRNKDKDKGKHNDRNGDRGRGQHD